MPDYAILTGYPVAVGAAINDANDVMILIDAGIGAIIDCRSEFDDGQLLAEGGIAYMWDPRDDDGRVGPEMDFWWDIGLRFGLSHLLALPALRIPAEDRDILYCHCAAGINRGPSMAYGVLRAAYGLTPEGAEAAIRQVRPQVGLAYARDFDRYWAAKQP